VGGAVVLVHGAGAEVRGFDGLSDHVRFAYPAALGVGEDDGDGVAGGLEGGNEGVDVWGGFVGWGTIVIDYLEKKY
jgi:hypothetical protein